MLFYTRSQDTWTRMKLNGETWNLYAHKVKTHPIYRLLLSHIWHKTWNIFHFSSTLAGVFQITFQVRNRFNVLFMVPKCRENGKRKKKNNYQRKTINDSYIENEMNNGKVLFNSTHTNETDQKEWRKNRKLLNIDSW